ncbi:serine/threonine-protein kinase [Streptomyces sp. RFCAC02]|uniref:serine/threonine-protein kinase n=1 Tax=Streptomyces sp. RFCAC02 TaxID=2499143 RepID=UPI0019D190E1|nr:serine/threonine-protein kinase [Streptomyces sp. RFCAC02]
MVLATGADGELVAIKMVHAHLARDDDFRRRFRREAAATRTVAGDRVASVVHADPDAEAPWLASEFVHGPALREVVDDIGPLPQDAVVRLAAGLAAALRDIHGAGLVHRDLSPSNVLLAEDGPKVIDFGIVRAADGASRSRHTSLTGVGSLIGAPGFMSPEQASGQPVTPATDVFSLGTTLLVACTGTNPFEGPGVPQSLYNVVHTEPDLAPLPDPLRRIIEPCQGPRAAPHSGPAAGTHRPGGRNAPVLARRDRPADRAAPRAGPPPRRRRAAPGLPPHIMSAPEPARSPVRREAGPARATAGPAAGGRSAPVRSRPWPRPRQPCSPPPSS